MVHLQLDDAVAAAFATRAAAQGLSLQAYLESLVVEKSDGASARISLDELDRLLDEEATYGSSPAGSFSRADL
jgi:hypothetical protein